MQQVVVQTTECHHIPNTRVQSPPSLVSTLTAWTLELAFRTMLHMRSKCGNAGIKSSRARAIVDYSLVCVSGGYALTVTQFVADLLPEETLLIFPLVHPTVSVYW